MEPKSWLCRHPNNIGTGDFINFAHRICVLGDILQRPNDGLEVVQKSYVLVRNRLSIPLYLQIALGYTPYQMGMFSGAGALPMAVVGIFAGQLSDKYGPNGFTTAGISISVAGLAILANLNMDSSWVHPLAGMVCCSFGLGTFYGPNNKIILASVPRNFHGVVSGFIHLARNSSTVISIAVGILVVTTFMSSMGFAPTLAGLSSDTDFPVLNSFVNGMRVGFIAFATILILALAVSLCGGTYEEIEVAD